jgi:hypothetical protein
LGVEAEDLKAARVRPDQGGEDGHEGRLSSAVGAEDPEDFALIDGEGYLVKNLLLFEETSKALADLLGPQRQHRFR